MHSILCHCEYLNDSFMQIIDVKSIFYKYFQTNVIILVSIRLILCTAAKPFSAEFTNRFYFMILTFQNDRIISYTLSTFSFKFTFSLMIIVRYLGASLITSKWPSLKANRFSFTLHLGKQPEVMHSADAQCCGMDEQITDQTVWRLSRADLRSAVSLFS